MPIRRAREARLQALTDPKNEEQTMLALTERITGGQREDMDNEDGTPRYTEPQTLGSICKELDVPQTRFLRWLQSDDKRWETYLKAHEAKALNLVDQAVEIAKRDSPYVQRDRLIVETNFRYAKAYASGQFGDKVRVEGGGRGAVVDAALLGAATELLDRIKKPQNRVIDSE